MPSYNRFMTLYNRFALSHIYKVNIFSKYMLLPDKIVGGPS